MCFANPGTTELPFVTALDSVPEVQPVLSLFEGVCSGAADGYFRISRKPAMVLTHLGPGFANSIATSIMQDARAQPFSMSLATT